MPIVAVFGSCVTRDLFEAPTLRPTLGPFLARCSVISAVAPPVPLDPERVVISSDWQRRCVLADFHKTFFDWLAQGRPDWLVVDLIDERFDVLRTAGSFVTRSSVFQAAGLDEAAGLAFDPVRRVSEEGCTLFELAAEEFAERVAEVLEPERVVLHRALWCDRYLDGGEVRSFDARRLELARRENEMLRRGYDALEAAFDGRALVVEVDAEHQLADAGHRWELEPYHYAAAYNDDATGRLQRLFGLA
jgi:hypothetical protein